MPQRHPRKVFCKSSRHGPQLLEDCTMEAVLTWSRTRPHLPITMSICIHIYIYIWCWGQLKLTTCGRPGQVSLAKLRTLEPSMVRVWVHRGDIAALNSGLVSTAHLKSHEIGLKVAYEYGSIWLVWKNVERRWKKTDLSCLINSDSLAAQVWKSASNHGGTLVWRLACFKSDTHHSWYTKKWSHSMFKDSEHYMINCIVAGQENLIALIVYKNWEDIDTWISWISWIRIMMFFKQMSKFCSFLSHRSSLQIRQFKAV